MSPWLVINTLAFVGTPAGLLDGWLAYAKLGEKSTVRSRLGLAALLLAVSSVVLLIAYIVIPIPSTETAARWLSRVGIYAGIAGIAASICTRPRLIASCLFANVGAVMLWFGLTLP